MRFEPPPGYHCTHVCVHARARSRPSARAPRGDALSKARSRAGVTSVTCGARGRRATTRDIAVVAAGFIIPPAQYQSYARSTLQNVTRMRRMQT